MHLTGYSLVPLADIFNHKAAVVALTDEYAIEGGGGDAAAGSSDGDGGSSDGGGGGRSDADSRGAADGESSGAPALLSVCHCR